MKGRRISIPLTFVILLILASLFSDFLSSNPPGMQNLDQFFQSPSRIRILDKDGGIRSPFIYQVQLKNSLDARYEENQGSEYSLQFFFKGYPYRLFGVILLDRHLIGRSQSPLFYPLGTDEFGRDVLARVLAGTRTSMLVVLLGLILYGLMGMTIGALAGLWGGWVDSLLMRFAEFVLALPALYLVLSLRALLPVRIPFVQALFLMVGILAAVAWPPMARGIRGLILQLRNAGFVEAARSSGGTRFYIFRQHMLPALIPFALSQMVVAAPVFLLGEVVLSFLDIGFHEEGASWGSMLQNMKDLRILTDFWWNLLPLFMVFSTLLCLNLLGNRISGRRSEDRRTMRI